jgi:hypothetical protein
MNFAIQAVSWSEWFIKLWADVQGTLLESIRSLITSVLGRLPFLLAAAIVLVLFWLFSKLVRSAFMAATRRGGIDTRLRLLIGRLIVGAVYIIGLFTALTVVIPSFDLGSLIAGLGFTSFVIGFATKDILNNFLSGMLILWQRPFEIGDYLFVGKDQGKVEYIGVRATSLRKDDGETPYDDKVQPWLRRRGDASEGHGTRGSRRDRRRRERPETERLRVGPRPRGRPYHRKFLAGYEREQAADGFRPGGGVYHESFAQCRDRTIPAGFDDRAAAEDQ